MFDWLFHWMHDGEVLKALIPAIGYVFVGAITWIGIWRTSKIAKQTLEDTREATPPELLRLEKWSTILKDSNDYPENIKYNLDMGTIKSTYNDILKRATLENRVKKLGVTNKEVSDILLTLPTLSSRGEYPKNIKWNKLISKKFIFAFIFALLVEYVIILSYSISRGDIFLGIVISVTVLSGSIIVGFMIYLNHLDKLEKDLILRNSYKALSDIFVLDNVILEETPEEDKQRIKLTNNKIFLYHQSWKEYKKNKRPDWDSWNYGLSIGWNNSPKNDKEKSTKEPTVGSSVDAAPSSGSSQEAAEG